MTETQNKKTTAAASLWNVGADLDNKHTQLARIGNILYVFGEIMDEEVRFLQEHKATSHFVGRYDIIKSLLDTANLDLIDMIKEMRVCIDAIYEHSKVWPTGLADN